MTATTRKRVSTGLAVRNLTALGRKLPVPIILVALLGSYRPAVADVIYDSLYHPLPPNEASQPYQAQQISAFGDAIQFAGAARHLTSVTVTMSDWALYSDWSSAGYNAAGWTWPLTLTLYNVDNSSGTPALGSIIISQTINPLIQWRPIADGCGGDPTAYTGSDGTCNHGIAQNVAFDFSGITIPNQLAYVLSYSTQTYGPDATGVAGPYNSLNFGLNYVYQTNTPPYVGSQLDPTNLFVDSAPGGHFTNYGATPNQLSLINYPDPYYYVPAVQFQATTPEPPTLALLAAAGLIGVGGARRRKKRG